MDDTGQLAGPFNLKLSTARGIQASTQHPVSTSLYYYFTTTLNRSTTLKGSSQSQESCEKGFVPFDYTICTSFGKTFVHFDSAAQDFCDSEEKSRGLEQRGVWSSVMEDFIVSPENGEFRKETQTVYFDKFDLCHASALVTTSIQDTETILEASHTDILRDVSGYLTGPAEGRFLGCEKGGFDDCSQSPSQTADMPSARAVNKRFQSLPAAIHHGKSLSCAPSIKDPVPENRSVDPLTDKRRMKRTVDSSLLFGFTACLCLLLLAPRAQAFDTTGIHFPITHSNLSVPCPVKCLCKQEGGGLRVDCSGQNLTSVPVEIDPSTRHLDLSGNNISKLPENAFSRLTHLMDLRLASNKLTTLPRKIFRKNRLLSTLYLQGNQFKSVPRGALQNLRQLTQLHLDANEISEVPSNCFKNLSGLKQLWLDFNKLTSIPSRALSSLTNLEALTLALNQITTIENYAFRNLSRLVVLLLNQNRFSKIEDYAFLGLKSLRILELNKNQLTEIPSSLSHLENLAELNLEENQVESLPDNSFAKNRKLSMIQLHKNPITSFGSRVFSNLPLLEKISVSEARDVMTFPDLTGTNNLTLLRLDRASIQVIPPGLCQTKRGLKHLDLHSNKISLIPDLSGCNMLLNLNLGNNQLTTLENQPFRGLFQLRDLSLQYNYIEHIPADAFIGLTKLQYLDLQHNRITAIHPSAFVPLSALADLNMADNLFSALPTGGLENVEKLKLHGNVNLRDFPPKESFPKAHVLILEYAYHCCDFLQSTTRTESVEMMDEQVTWLGDVDGDVAGVWQERYNNLTDFWNTYFDNFTQDLWEDFQSDEYNPEDYDLAKEAELFLEDYEPENYQVHFVMAKPPVSCKPKPGPFMPCDDLFGWWGLRCGVWFVFMLALLGNAVVLFVSVSSRSKMDVPRFLICNLACADFFMGVYLGILAMVDASTLGEFRMHAISWQISAGCLVAGFLGVLSSELSVFTLTVITLERSYAITHAMQLNKRLSLRQAGYIMLGGWLFAIALASLPLFGVSDYRKFAVCLPFEVEDVISKSYVTFIMVFNGLSFCIILACYLIMYLSIRHSQAWNSNDTRVAKRMALLVFTDFLCWAPIAVLSISASFGNQLIDLSEAKVLTIFVLPLNSCANPFLYAIFTKQFKRDCVLLCRRLEDSSIARHFSRVSHRHVSFTWGSSRRPSQLNSLVNGEKGGSCSHSGAGGGYGNGGGSSMGYHSDPDSGKGSLDFDKMQTGDLSPAPDCYPWHPKGCQGKHSASGEEGEDCEHGDYESTNAYNEMLNRCNKRRASEDGGEQDEEEGGVRGGGGGGGGWKKCGKCHVVLHQRSPNNSNNNFSSHGRQARLSDDLNCTTETYLPDTDDNNDHDRHHHHHKHSHQKQQHQHHTNGNHRTRKDRQKDEICKKPGCSCRHGDKSGGKKSRGKKGELILPVVSYKGGNERVDIHSKRHGSSEARCCRGSDGMGCLGGGLRCCSSANSSPVETGRHYQDPQCRDYPHYLPGPDPRASNKGAGDGQGNDRPSRNINDDDNLRHTCDVATQDEGQVETKPDDADSGNDAGGESGSVDRATSSDAGVAELAGESGSLEEGINDMPHEGERTVHAPRNNLTVVNNRRNESVSRAGETGDTSVEGGGGHKASSGGGRGRGGVVVTRAGCRRAVDKSEHLRFFTESLAAHPHACRSNSLVELTQTSQARLSAHLSQGNGSKRLSLTPRQDGYLQTANSAESPLYPHDDEEDAEFPPYEDLQRYLHSSKYQASRAHASDRHAAAREEVSGLLDGNEDYNEGVERPQRAVGKSNSFTYDKESGISSEHC